MGKKSCPCLSYYSACLVALFLFITLPTPSWAQPPSPLWTGDGGRGIRVTVAEPTGTGLSPQEESLLPLIQSTIIGTFQRFSGMTVFDRQNLENILREQLLALDANFSDDYFIRIGHLTNARLVVFGSVHQIAGNYILELAVTDVETGERRASYPPRPVSLLALQNLSAIREASANLLGQLGVNLTASGLQELRRAENSIRVQAENALARGIAAQRQGMVAEALAYYFRAAAFNPALGEALNRVSVVATNVAGGNLGHAVRGRLHEHDEWRTIVDTALSFYSNHLPYEFVYDTDIRQGAIDFTNRTTELSVGISLVPTEAWNTINDLRRGLSTARRNDNWGFDLYGIARQITVSMQLLNQDNAVLSTASQTFSNPSETNQTNDTLIFRGVRADEITDRLIVQIVSVNEVPVQRAGETGLIQIMTLADHRRRLAAAAVARREREAVRVAAGTAHTVAIRADGSLWAWGLNSNGQLGDGMANNRSTPVRIGTATNWATVAAGERHTVAIRTDGSLWTWGDNAGGRTGLGTVSGSTRTPTRIGADNDWLSVSTGWRHTVAIRVDGSLWAWGLNEGGQLGDGTTTSRNTPTRIGTATDWRFVSAGVAHTVAVRTDGSLWAWGLNSNGQLGDGTTNNRGSPVRIGMATNWASIAAGNQHTMAITRDGELWAWGNNYNGQLGDGTIINRNSPVRVGATTNWASVSAGAHTVGIRTDGSLWIWGNDRDGQFGRGSATNRSTPVQIGMATSWVFVASGNQHTLGIWTDGSLWAWGDNFSGQLGNGRSGMGNMLASPVQVQPGTAWVSR